MSNKNNSNAKKVEAAKAEQAKKAEKLAETKEAKKVNEVSETDEVKVAAKRYRVKTTVSFKKRNYSIDGKNILLIAGEEVTEATRNKFKAKCQEVFFEEI